MPLLMNRRNFLGSLIGGIAATAAVRAWPFRVYSFPQEIEVLSLPEITERYLAPAIRGFVAMSLRGNLAVTRENSIVKPTPDEMAKFFEKPKNRIVHLGYLDRPDDDAVVFA